MEHPLRRPELLVCATRGHALPGAEIETLDERHAAFARPTTDGRRFAQCQRCGSWIVTDGPAAGTGLAPDAVQGLGSPRRGKALRQAMILRLIAIDKAVHAVAFATVAVAAIVLDHRVDALHSWALSVRDALQNAHAGNGGASAHGLLAALLQRLSTVTHHSLTVIALFAAAYAVVSAIECVGLWRERRWAEYLTAIVTASFLPLEIHELLDRVTLVRITAFAVNVAILVYLVWAKHLFGLRGPLPEAESTPLEPLPDLAAVTAGAADGR